MFGYFFENVNMSRFCLCTSLSPPFNYEIENAIEDEIAYLADHLS